MNKKIIQYIESIQKKVGSSHINLTVNEISNALELSPLEVREALEHMIAFDQLNAKLDTTYYDAELEVY
ncbi:hypothetical protein VNN36_07960 [Lactococcus garvieae]|uniref:hypothetical protein n=1 Tax=Lactococcus garvieae TaxID=1363 RepID=UPI0030CDFCFF